MDAPPAKRFTREKDADAGPNAEEPRGFQYFTPAKRRASLYEDVTVDTQPSVHRHVQRGYPLAFDDGSPMWSDDSTLLRSSDWFAFRDPGGEWERTFYQRGATYEKQIEGAVASAASDRLFDDFTPEWVEYLRTTLQVPSYVEHGLWLATATIARDCLSDTVSHCVAFESALKQRLAQAVVLYGMDLEPHLGPMPIEPAQERFLNDPTWQPVRAYLEKLRATPDWMEVLVAANLCFEPIVGVFLRREIGIRAATANGDSVTSAIFRTGQLEWDWTKAWTSALFTFLLKDEQHAAHNRATLEGWLDDWLPQARAAVAALGGLAEDLPVGIDVDAALERVHRDCAVFHEEAGIGDLVPVAT